MGAVHGLSCERVPDVPTTETHHQARPETAARETRQEGVLKHKYKMQTTLDRGKTKMQAVLTRDDGLEVRSSWWWVDDGSAEQEAYELMHKREQEEP